MSSDAIIIGGGLGGSTLATSLAEAGYRVLVLERAIRFKDRVRGEQMHPWEWRQRVPLECTTTSSATRLAGGLHTWPGSQWPTETLRRQSPTGSGPSISIIPACKKVISSWLNKPEHRFVVASPLTRSFRVILRASSSMRLASVKRFPQ